MTHGNRSKRNRSAKSNPTPTEVRAARAAARHDQKQAADLIYSTATTWIDWEDDASDRRRMHPALFELYLLKTGQKTLDQLLDEAAARSLGIPSSEVSPY